ARDELMTHHRGQCPPWALISDEDRAKGFADGKLGYDAPLNIALIIIGWLYGEEDFEKSLLIIINCGEDTDCTAGTFAAIYGIIHGINGIPEKWKAPIGRAIKTISLNLGDLGYMGDLLPRDIDELTDRTYHIAVKVLAQHAPHVRFTGDAPDSTEAGEMKSLSHGADLYPCQRGPITKTAFMDVMTDYPDGVFARDGQPICVRLKVIRKHRIPQGLNLRIYTPDGWMVSPSKRGKINAGEWVTLRFTAQEVPENVNRFAAEVTVDGTATVVLAPLVLLNGNLRGPE
ncbi:MAG: ADP-ribosylglycohydrolase family protein, partial [Clostridia bacterium]|nr:ADP-ribosylglycohydrolase family protein [Clostridia bacterium]